MKTLLNFGLVLAVLLLLIAPAAAQADVFQVTSTANVRTGHGIEYPVIGQVFRGSVLNILAYSPTANWVQVDLGGGRNGWVFAHLGEILRSGNATPIVTTAPVVSTNNLGQGGGFVAPTYGTGGSVVNAPTTSQSTANLGQGGGFAAPLYGGTQFTGTMSIEEFNSTVGVTASANMRRGPSLYNNVVWIIPYGERAVPLARNANGTWILVNYAGYEGWVFFELIAAPPAIDLTALPVR